jgi:hypothetical protein
MRKTWLSWNVKSARFPFNNRGDISWLGPGFGQMLAGNDYMGNSPKNEPPAPPPAPDPNAAANTALDAQSKQRRALLATGGQTEFAGSGGMLLGSDIHSLNLGGN